jgi:molybdopterin-containing oxidoreductase family iron-sulfur binding subunit
MKNGQQGIWIGSKDLNRDEAFIMEAQNEIQNPSLVEQLGNKEVTQGLESNRRDFLKFLGFGVGAATMAGCDIPVKRAIPYVIKPDEIVPGVATYYASSFVKGGDYCPILVKTREGRPIKIEGNALSSVTNGGTSARAQAHVLSLYDTNRYKSPQIVSEEETKVVSWEDFDSTIKTALQSALATRIVTNTIMSPTAKKVLEGFTAAYGNAEVVTYDPVSSAAILDANEQSFGDRAIPEYRFDKAETIVAFNADFLGTWISPIEYANQYAINRKIKDVKNARMSRHIQVESHMSLTGSNADNRVLVKPSEQGVAVAYLYEQITGNTISAASRLNAKAKAALSKVAGQLKESAGKSLVVSGSNNVSEQILINAINSTLGNYGNTLSFDHASHQRQGSEKAMADLLAELKGGKVDTLIFLDCNPLYNSSVASELTTAVDKVKNKIGLCYSKDETSTVCNYIAPLHHGLESWGDVEAKRGVYSLIQPTISPLFDTRQGEETLLAWSGYSESEGGDDQPYMAYLKSNWEASYFPTQEKYLGFQSFWDSVLHDGVYSTAGYSTATDFNADLTAAARGISAPSSSELEVQFYEPVTVGNGQYADNPWLQEMPDPVSRYTWGNFVAVPVSFDGDKAFEGFNGLEDGDLVDVTVGDQTYRLPAVQQFGIMPGTVAIALGYGRSSGGFASKGIGVNVNSSLGNEGGLTQYFSVSVSVSNKKGKESEYSSVQYFDTMGVTAEETATGETINADEAALAPGYGNVVQGFQGALVERSIIRHTDLGHLEEAVDHLKHEREHHQGLNEHTLYPFDEYSAEKYSQGHHWGMHVDLNACTGCGACTVACMAENNVPVVGKQKVSIHQEMAWLRIDRYYYGDVENPNTVYQPLMCQHCDNAPCENVCPVNATNHSSEGLNQMAYNRCVGTRYCANNCPYKVRRFNWSDYTTADIFPANQVKVNEEEVPFGADNLTRMVLNPDVTVRSRGVIEKCSFCVQRIQEGKLTAKSEGRGLNDTDVKTACQTACPTGAITFGDRNNKKGELYEKFHSPLNYIVLEEVNVQSSVQYTMKVNNRDKTLDA